MPIDSPDEFSNDPPVLPYRPRPTARQRTRWVRPHAHLYIALAAVSPVLPAVAVMLYVSFTSSVDWGVRLLGVGLSAVGVAFGWWCVATALHRRRNNGRAAWYETWSPVPTSWTWVPLAFRTAASGLVAWLIAGRSIGWALLPAAATAVGASRLAADAVRWVRRDRRDRRAVVPQPALRSIRP